MIYYFFFSASDKTQAEIQQEIQALIRQITVTVTVLPLLKEPCLCIYIGTLIFLSIIRHF